VVNSVTAANSLTYRPNMTCNPNALQGRKAGKTSFYINPTCFSLPTTNIGGTTLINNSQSGNEPRGVAVGPGFNTTDLSLFKQFEVRHGQTAELRFEAFNVFNEAHFAQPVLTFAAAGGTGVGANVGSTAAASTFGRVTSTVGSDSRVIQLAFKYSF